MKQYWSYLNEIAQHAEEMYAQPGYPVNWYHPYRSIHLEERRNELLDGLSDHIQWDFNHTKPFINSISKGCQLCGEGEWSCLFVTGKCNANCFYCPAVQDKDETPQTQKLLFEHPETYAEYINRFNFKGVSFSGGEPLLVFDRTLAFIQMVRKRCDPSIYMWMYTNGILAGKDKFRILADAGLDEIRFDLGAVNYNPGILKNASSFINHVTVEIPAIPEEKETIARMLSTLCEYGVTNLNLHQLRLTKYNAPKLLERAYTYLHGEQPVVAESELAALEVIDVVKRNRLPIGVNYCNFQFKNRFQKAGFRTKMARVLLIPGEEITGNGFIRVIETEENGVFHPILLEELQRKAYSTGRIRLTYKGRALENLNGNSDGSSFLINGEEFPIIQGHAIQPLYLSGEEITGYLEMMSNRGRKIPDHPALFEAWKQEFIEEGLREFF